YIVRPMTCEPNRAKLSAHTRESTESSPPGMPCCSRQLRSGNTQPSTASKIFMPSASATLGPAMPSSDSDMLTTILLISAPSARAPRAPAHPLVGAGRHASTWPAGFAELSVVLAGGQPLGLLDE